MSRKILVADDEPDLKDLIRQIFRSRIKSGEFTFDFAENGAVALEKLKADPEIEVLFTDINMPVMDGLTLLNNIKEDGLLQKAVVISAYGDLKNIRTAMNRGAFDFVTKPIDITDLEATLSKAISEMEVFRKGLEAIKENERLIVEQNEKLELQVKERTAEIVHQKEIIEDKNKEILDSIHYAKRLQAAILPPERQMNEFFAQHFTLYMPKDIVAGDFYWAEMLDDHIYLVAADCTGHGVSGALMSMLGVSLLSRVVNEKQITEPGAILNALHLAVIAALKQQENETHDGMDILLCRFTKDFTELTFAGANRPLWLVRNGILEEFKTDKMPIGGLQIEHISFTTLTLSLEKNDMLYLSTDGYADQFGGEAGKKLMTKRFKEVLTEISGKSLNDQKEHLYKVHNDWKGEQEQVDDILVIGVRINNE